jgi:hypothetical protein
MGMRGFSKPARRVLVVAVLVIGLMGLAPLSAKAASPPSKTFSISDAQAVEGSSGGCSGAGVVFTVTRSFKGGKANVTVSPDGTGTASLGTDYASGSVTASFKGGRTSTQVTIPVCQDTDVEPDETFGVILQSPEIGYTIATGSATGTIVSDEVCAPGSPGCGWKQGDMLSYNQSAWGDGTSAAGSLLAANFDSIFPADLVVGDAITARFTSASAVFNYLPASGVIGPLNSNLTDPATTSSGEFGGHVVALQINVEFSDADLLASTTALGDLRICDFNVISAVNGMTVRQFLTLANFILGGGTGAQIDADEASAVAFLINNSFVSGSPSTFAQDHLVIGPCP